MDTLTKQAERLQRAADALNRRLSFLNECKDACDLAQHDYAQAMREVEKARAELQAANEAWAAMMTKIV